MPLLPFLLHNIPAMARHVGHPIRPWAPPPPIPAKKVTINTLRAQHKKGDPITVLTAHDFPSAMVADHAGMDLVLVGDSLAMVAMGMDDTSEVLVEEMLLHCRSVARATKSAFTVCFSPQESSLLARHLLTMTDWRHAHGQL